MMKNKAKKLLEATWEVIKILVIATLLGVIFGTIIALLVVGLMILLNSKILALVIVGLIAFIGLVVTFYQLDN